MARLAGKVAIVTGGGTGLGAAIAQRFVAEGASVLAVGRREDVLAATVKEIGHGTAGGAIAYAVADTSRVDDTERYVAEAVRRFGGLDILVSNAGVLGPVQLTSEHAVEDFDAVLAVNVRGVWLSFKHALPELVARGGGSVILMSSIAGHYGFPAAAPYVASKHAVIGLAKTFALEGAPVGIRVNAVLPGHIDTPMFDQVIQRAAPLFETDEATALGIFCNRIPLKRRGTPEEIAQLVLFLASDDSSYVSGASYVADGAETAGLL